MNKIFRIIDANLNRVSEGLRTLEDIARFHFEEAELSLQIKTLRHSVRKSTKGLELEFIKGRDSLNDVGYQAAKKTNLDCKASFWDLLQANSKRVQEGLRVIEENLHLLNHPSAKIYEECRYKAYEIEKTLLSLLAKNQRKNPLNTDLYAITAEEHSLGRSNIEIVEELIAAGIKIIQYREKNKSKRDKYYECLAIRDLTKKARVTFIVNDDVDIALAVRADGIHIGQDDTPIEKVREIVGEDMIIGLSTHSPQQAEDAVQRGADYIGVGPIFKTYTKKDVCDPVGFTYLDYVVKNIALPFVAIGGIKLHNIDEVYKSGARCIAMVTEIVGSENIQDAVKRLRDKLNK